MSSLNRWALLPELIAKSSALAPGPRVHLTRFHGVFAPNSKHRVQVTPAKRGKHKQPEKAEPANNDWLDKSLRSAIGR